MLEHMKNTMFFGLNKTGNLLLSPPIGGGLGQFRNHGPRDKRKIALTFDDGPSKPCTEELIEAMGEMNVRGTFFCVGQNAVINADLLRRMDTEGHVIGNHSLAHRRITSIKPWGGDHIDEGARYIGKILGKLPRLYRPPRVRRKPRSRASRVASFARRGSSWPDRVGDGGASYRTRAPSQGATPVRRTPPV